MIKLRELNIKDAPYMLEWMHDQDIQKAFRVNMMEKTLEDAIAFCRKASACKVLSEGDDIHYAIASEEDEYLGTISLKDISLTNKTAEYAIAMRKKAMGRGLATQATNLILCKAFEELSLNRVYLNVLSENVRAIRLYERCGFVYEGEFRDHIMIDGSYRSLKYYGMLAKEFHQYNDRATEEL